MVLLEWKIDENQENELRQLLNNQDFASLESFLKDQNNLSQLQKINNPDEIIVFFNSKFDNKTKGGGGIDSKKNLDLINSQINDIKLKISGIESKSELTTDDKREKYALNKKLIELEDKKTAEAIKSKQEKREDVIKSKQDQREDVIKHEDKTTEDVIKSKQDQREDVIKSKQDQREDVIKSKQAQRKKIRREFDEKISIQEVTLKKINTIKWLIK